MAWKWTEEVFLACFTLVNIDVNDNKFAQEVPQLKSEGQCMLLAHFENYLVTTRKALSSEVLKMYLQSPVTELYKNGVVNVPVIPKGQSILKFFQQCDHPRSIKKQTEKKLILFLTDLQVTTGGLIVHRNEWNGVRKPPSQRFLASIGRLGTNKQILKMNNELFILQDTMRHVIIAAFHYMQDNRTFVYPGHVRQLKNQTALRKQIKRFLSIASIDLNVLVDSPWQHEVSTATVEPGKNTKVHQNAIHEPCKLICRQGNEAVVKLLYGNRIIERQVDIELVRERSIRYFKFHWSDDEAGHQYVFKGDSRTSNKPSLLPGVGIYCPEIGNLIKEIDETFRFTYTMMLLAKDEQQRNRPTVTVIDRTLDSVILKNTAAIAVNARSRQTFATKAKLLFVHLHPDVEGPANTKEAWKKYYGETYRTMNDWWTKPSHIRGWLCYLEKMTWEQLRSEQKVLKKTAPIFCTQLQTILLNLSLTGGIPEGILMKFKPIVEEYEKKECLRPAACGSGHRSKKTFYVSQTATTMRTAPRKSTKYPRLEEYLQNCITHDIANGNPKSRLHYEKLMIRFCMRPSTIKDKFPRLNDNILQALVQEANEFNTSVSHLKGKDGGFRWQVSPCVSTWFTRFMDRNGLYSFFFNPILYNLLYIHYLHLTSLP